MKKFLRREEGFTLIELLVVVAVLGILAALAIPRLTGVTDKARLAEAQQAIGSLKTAAEMYFVEKNTYAGLDKSAIEEYIDWDSLPANWTYSIEVKEDGTGFTIKAEGEKGSANEKLGARINEKNEIYTTRDTTKDTNW